jgi:hypothetical protein
MGTLHPRPTVFIVIVLVICFPTSFTVICSRSVVHKIHFLHVFTLRDIYRWSRGQ